MVSSPVIFFMQAQVIGGTQLSPNQGRVMVEIDNTWGTICGEGWDLLDAAVLCRQMGMGYARYALEVSQLFVKHFFRNVLKNDSKNYIQISSQYGKCIFRS